MEPLPAGTVLVFFDGVCNFCNNTVNWIIKHDPKGIIKFASLQSAYAQTFLPTLGIEPEQLSSVIVVCDRKVYLESDAALRIGKALGTGWRTLAAFGYVVPPFLRNATYKLVARNRYKWFGKRDTCRMPTPEERSRFVGV
jgi:predicted DCC family thiol-disulfide oxidoreductase YuxK